VASILEKWRSSFVVDNTENREKFVILRATDLGPNGLRVTKTHVEKQGPDLVDKIIVLKSIKFQFQTPTANTVVKKAVFLNFVE